MLNKFDNTCVCYVSYSALYLSNQPLIFVSLSFDKNNFLPATFNLKKLTPGFPRNTNRKHNNNNVNVNRSKERVYEDLVIKTLNPLSDLFDILGIGIKEQRKLTGHGGIIWVVQHQKSSVNTKSLSSKP